MAMSALRGSRKQIENDLHRRVILRSQHKCYRLMIDNGATHRLSFLCITSRLVQSPLSQSDRPRCHQRSSDVKGRHGHFEALTPRHLIAILGMLAPLV